MQSAISNYATLGTRLHCSFHTKINSPVISLNCWISRDRMSCKVGRYIVLSVTRERANTV